MSTSTLRTISWAPYRRCRRKNICQFTTSATRSGQNLLGKTALITGASRGIGRAIAEKFSQEGAACILVGRHEGRLNEVLNVVNEHKDGHVEHSIRVGDVGDWNFWDSLKTDGVVKNVDVLVNAAGVTHYSLLMATQRKSVEDVVRTNLMGSIWACQILSRIMIRRREGCIINISSLLGIKGGQGNTVYAASKAGLIGLTRSLAAEVGAKGVRVNAILPGYIETQMTEAMTPEARTQAIDAIPMKRFGKVEEVAEAALFLARNNYANNCVLNLDGGLSAV